CLSKDRLAPKDRLRRTTLDAWHCWAKAIEQRRPWTKQASQKQSRGSTEEARQGERPHPPCPSGWLRARGNRLHGPPRLRLLNSAHHAGLRQDELPEHCAGTPHEGCRFRFQACQFCESGREPAQACQVCPPSVKRSCCAGQLTPPHVRPGRSATVRPVTARPERPHPAPRRSGWG